MGERAEARRHLPPAYLMGEPVEHGGIIRGQGAPYTGGQVLQLVGITHQRPQSHSMSQLASRYSRARMYREHARPYLVRAA